MSGCVHALYWSDRNGIWPACSASCNLHGRTRRSIRYQPWRRFLGSGLLRNRHKHSLYLLCNEHVGRFSACWNDVHALYVSPSIGHRTVKGGRHMGHKKIGYVIAFALVLTASLVLAQKTKHRRARSGEQTATQQLSINVAPTVPPVEPLAI